MTLLADLDFVLPIGIAADVPSSLESVYALKLGGGDYLRQIFQINHRKWEAMVTNFYKSGESLDPNHKIKPWRCITPAQFLHALKINDLLRAPRRRATGNSERINFDDRQLAFILLRFPVKKTHARIVAENRHQLPRFGIGTLAGGRTGTTRTYPTGGSSADLKGML